jgi:SPP1 family predicted phage head-tail adaptor
MRSGQMRHLLIFQARTETADGIGGVTVAWGDYFSAWAKLETLGPAERVEAQKLTGRVPMRFVVYYDPDIVPTLRIKWSPDGTARYFTIQGIRDMTGQRRTMVIDAVEDEDS